ncbi:Conserved hypothetical protein [Prochlorococcus marinus str. MIT 9313]|uniref:Uncharacterized protein n=1 Tax=Prochlorococcus marinus (strain MIT 9313) TaxID=74547 RepID=B9ES91_PROMM|nr:Conserved hypothetical protein [Prochlorococcus marinus str. MIT 9313]
MIKVPGGSHRSGHRLRSRYRPTSFSATGLLAIALQNHLQAPAVTITIQTSPPRLTFHLQADRFLCQQLINKLLMLISEFNNQRLQTLPLILSELDSPAFPSNQHWEGFPSRVPGKSPARALLLNHHLSQAADPVGPARRLVQRWLAEPASHSIPPKGHQNHRNGAASPETQFEP